LFDLATMGNICCKQESDKLIADKMETKAIIVEKKKLKSNVPNLKDFLSVRFVHDISNHYKMGKVLGSGKFGTVHRATRKNIGINCAMKSIPKDTVKSGAQI